MKGSARLEHGREQGAINRYIITVDPEEVTQLEGTFVNGNARWTTVWMVPILTVEEIDFIRSQVWPF